jgi:hypothetical protein
VRQQQQQEQRRKQQRKSRQSRLKVHKKLSPEYLAKLAAVKAKFGPDLYGDLVWWKDQGTIEGEAEQAKLDALAEAEVKAKEAVKKDEQAKAKAKANGGSSSSSSSWFGGSTLEMQVKRS